MVLCYNIKVLMFCVIIFTKFGFDAPGEPRMLKQAVVNSQMNQFSLRTSTFQSNGQEKHNNNNTQYSWPLNSNENLVPLPFRTSFTILSRSWGISRKSFSTEMKPSQFPAKGKRRGKERGRRGEERKLKMRRRCRFLPSVRVRTLEAVIVLDEPKPA